MDTNPLETQKMECPRCNEEVSKSNFNIHMDQKHDVKNFGQKLKRSFQPGTSGIPPKKATKTKLEKPPKKAAETKLERGPLASTPGTSGIPPKKATKKKLEKPPKKA